MNYSPGEICGRNGCKGILYQKYDGSGFCTCNLFSPCEYCVEQSIGCCQECGWNEESSILTRKLLFEKYKKPVRRRRKGTRVCVNLI